MQYVTQLLAPHVGYTQAALQYLMALHTAGYRDFHLTPVGQGVSWSAMPTWTAPLATIRPATDTSFDLAIIHHTPDAVTSPQLRRGVRRNVALTVTETDRVPGHVATALNQLDAVIVPTWWNRDVLLESGVTVPIYVLPHTQGAYWWAGAAPLAQSQPYVFYYVGAWNKRKNPEGVLRAYLRAFPRPSSEVALAMKLSGNEAVRGLIAAIIEREGSSPDRLKQDIWVYSSLADGGGLWDDRKLSWFHDLGGCYVSAHRGEGFGLGSFQAALRGRPVIYTDWSAPIEYLSLEAGDIPVPARLVEVGDLGGSNPYFTDLAQPLRWAEPDMAALIAAMRKAARERRVRGPRAVESMRENYSWEAIGPRFVELIERLESGEWCATSSPV